MAVNEQGQRGSFEVLDEGLHVVPNPHTAWFDLHLVVANRDRLNHAGRPSATPSSGAVRPAHPEAETPMPSGGENPGRPGDIASPPTEG